MYICIGVPYFVGQRIEGRTEVEAIENSGFAAEIGAEWINVQPDFAAHDDPVVAVNRALAATIQAHSDKTPIIFASDCTSSFGSMKGLQAHDPAILWYDAHGDFNTHETTPSGFLGGMPLAMLVGRGQMTYMQALDLQPTDERDVVITDARDLDPEEGAMLAASGITHHGDVQALLTAPLPPKPLYIHFDTDIIDINEMPGMNYPAPDGPSIAETLPTLERAKREARVAGILFGLWDDRHQTEGKALAGVLALARAFVK